jgi:two-component system chemotaxis sensor kinase CheA
VHHLLEELNELVSGQTKAGDLSMGQRVLERVGRSFPELDGAARDAAEALLARDLGSDPRDEMFSQRLDALRRALEQDAGLPALFVEEPSSYGSLAQDPQLVADFVVEAREHLASIETLVLALEGEPGNQEAIHGTFRAFHTIKGLAGFLEFTDMQSAAHEVETILDRARNGQLTVSPALCDALLAGADYLNRLIERVESGSGGRDVPSIDPLRAALRRAEQPPAEEAQASTMGLPPAPEEDDADAPKRRSSGANTETASVKVQTTKLEYLVDMVGELVIAQSLLRHDQDLDLTRSPRLHRNLAQLARVTSEVQKTAMAMRMVPVGQLFRRMARLVRDLSRKSGKLAELETSGDDVELDRNIVEELSDPMVHMIRNAVDHGLEGPDERAAQGKPRTGRVFLEARHEAGQIVIEIRDDGRGLAREKILRKAVERGLITTGEALSDSEVFGLIFEPGFSTAEKVTDVSGRGVGMDVVRKQIEKLRGRVDTESTSGSGTRFLLKLPLTLAIIDGLVVGVGEERYIVPISSVREMFRPPADTLFTVEGKGEMALVRGRLLPVIRLYNLFGIKPAFEDPASALFIVSETNHESFCLLVDELLGKQEVVIKSLGPMFGRQEGIAGGAILGDGRVGLILDIASLTRLGRRGEHHGTRV